MAPRLKTASNKETNILIERQSEYFMGNLPFSSSKWKKEISMPLGPSGLRYILLNIKLFIFAPSTPPEKMISNDKIKLLFSFYPIFQGD